MLNLMQVGASRMLPWPDASIDDIDRWHFLGLYEPQFLPISGAEFAFIVPAKLTDFTVEGKKMAFIVPDKLTDFEA